MRAFKVMPARAKVAMTMRGNKNSEVYRGLSFRSRGVSFSRLSDLNQPGDANAPTAPEPDLVGALAGASFDILVVGHVHHAHMAMPRRPLWPPF